MKKQNTQPVPAGGGTSAVPVPTPSPVRPTSRPFLARHPEVGYLIFLVFTAIFVWLVWVVKTNFSPIIPWDNQVIRSVHIWARQQPAALKLFLLFMSSYGYIGLIVITLLLTVGWLRRHAHREAAMLLLGVVGGELWFQAISHIINRPRPVFEDPLYTLTVPGFPSGHTVTTVIFGMLVIYLLLPHIRSWARKALFILAVMTVLLLIILSRLFLGVHYPTDLIAGVSLGLAWGALVFTLVDWYFFVRTH